MSGELLIQTKSGWRTALAVLLSAALSGWVALTCLTRLPLEGMGFTISAALLVYVLFRLLYPVCDRLFPAKRDEGSGQWTVTPEMLVLNGTSIPRASIKMVHCWPNRDALGHTKAGWTVNIETAGKNYVLRSLTEGEDLERSVRQLRAMVVALGYETRWQEL